MFLSLAAELHNVDLAAGRPVAVDLVGGLHPSDSAVLLNKNNTLFRFHVLYYLFIDYFVFPPCRQAAQPESQGGLLAAAAAAAAAAAVA